jgi:hypothetical protein
VFASVTQTLSKTTIGQLGYQAERISGYQDSPFLRATVNGALMLGHVPDHRLRQTISARLRQALPAETFLEADRDPARRRLRGRRSASVDPI